MACTSTKLAALNQSQLEIFATQAASCAETGQLPDYVPLLAKADPSWFAAQVHLVEGSTYGVGKVEQACPLMSVIKPLLLLFLLQRFGQEAVFAQVGTNPSDQPFHSLGQLLIDKGFPRNPMLNSGAIALAELLPGDTAAARCETLRHWLNQQAGCHLGLDHLMLASVRSLGNQANRAIAVLLQQAGFLTDVDVTLDTYNHICCLSGTVVDLAQLGMLLAQPQPTLLPEHQQIVNALMLTCGLYEASGQFAVRIGLPIKSGVGGALLAIVPRQGAIACYSPTLDASGNPVAGLWLLERLARSLNLSVFSST